MPISTLTAADLTQLMLVQQNCYSHELIESATVMSERITAFGQSCWGYFIDQRMAGYLLAYPSIFGSITPLAAAFPHYKNANCLYLHDMAISADFRGQFLAPQLLTHARSEALNRGLRAMALVAVQGAEAYWAKQGFVKVTDLSAEQQAALASYLPQQACYMVLQLENTLSV